METKKEIAELEKNLKENVTWSPPELGWFGNLVRAFIVSLVGGLLIYKLWEWLY